MNQNKQSEGKISLNLLIAGIAGAIIGAGVAVAGLVILYDKKNRNKMVAVLQNIRDHAVGYINVLEKQAQDERGGTDRKITKSKKKVKKIATLANGFVHMQVKNVKKSA